MMSMMKQIVQKFQLMKKIFRLFKKYILYQMYDKIFKVCEGNPGALSVMKQILDNYPNKIEIILQKLITHNIKGSDIWTIYKEECKQDINCFLIYVSETDLNLLLKNN